MNNKYILIGTSFFVLILFLVILGCGGGGAKLILPQKTAELIPTAPVTGFVDKVFTETAEIMWQPPTSEVAAYNIYLNNNFYKTVTSENFQSLLLNGKTFYKYAVSSLKKDSTYVAVIKSVNSSGVESSSALTLKFKTMSKAEAPKKVETITLISSSLNSMKIHFPEVENTAKYLLYLDNIPYSLSTDEIFYFFNSGTYEIIRLSPNATYVLTIEAINGYGSSERSNEFTFNTGTVPSAPSNVLISNVLDTSFKVTWGMVTGATEYVVEYTNKTTNIRGSFSTATNLAVIQNLARGTTYEVGIRAKNSYGVSNLSSLKSTVTKNIPTVPANLSTMEVSISTFRVKWDAVSNAESYKIFKDSVFYSSTTDTNFNLTGLSNDETYRVEVSAVNKFGESAKSQPFYITTANVVEEAAVLPDPFNYTATNTSTRITLEWDVFEHATTYKITYRKTADTNIETLITTLPFVMIQNLTPGTEYTITIQGVNNIGPSAITTLTETTNSQPSAVNDVKVDTRNKNYIRINWSRAEGANNYRIVTRRINPDVHLYTFKKDTTENTTFEIFKDPTNSSATIADGDENILAGGTYEITVYSRYNSNEQTSVTNGQNRIFVKTPDTPPPPAIVSVDSVSTNSVSLSWSAVGDATYYNVYITKAGTTSTYEGISNTNYTVTNLSMNTNFTAEVTSVQVNPDNNDKLESEKSDPTAFKTLPPTPAKPGGAKYFNLTDDSVQLSWNNVAYATQYKINFPGGEFIPSEITSYSNSIIIDNNIGLWQGPGNIIPEDTVVEISALNNTDADPQESQAVTLTLNSITAPEINDTDAVTRPSIATAKTVTLKWKNKADTLYYLLSVEEETSSGSGIYSPVTGRQNIKVYTNEYFLTNMSSGTNYNFKLKAVLSAGESKTATLPIQTLFEPAPFTILGYHGGFPNYGTDFIDIGWEPVRVPSPYDSDIKTTKYVIYCKPASEQYNYGNAVGEYIVVDQNPLPGTVFTFKLEHFWIQGYPEKNPLVHDSAYNIKIVAQNGDSEIIEEYTGIRTDYIPKSPKSLTIDTVYTYGFDISWASGDTNPDRPAEYLVEWWQGEIQDPGEGSITSATTNNRFYEIRGLESDKSYGIRVKAVNETESAFTSTNVVTRKTGVGPEQPVIDTVTNITSDSLTLAWGSTNHTDYYVVRYSTDGTNWSSSSDITLTNYSIEGLLDPGTLYYLQVEAHNEYTSATSDNVTVTTKQVLDFYGVSTALGLNTISASSPYAKANNMSVYFTADGISTQYSKFTLDQDIINPDAPVITNPSLTAGWNTPYGITPLLSGEGKFFVSVDVAGTRRIYGANDGDGSAWADFNALDPAGNWDVTLDSAYGKVTPMNTYLYALTRGTTANLRIIRYDNITGTVGYDAGFEIPSVNVNQHAVSIMTDFNNNLITCNGTDKTASIWVDPESAAAVNDLNIASFEGLSDIPAVYAATSFIYQSKNYLVFACGNKIAVFYTGVDTVEATKGNFDYLGYIDTFTLTDPGDGLNDFPMPSGRLDLTFNATSVVYLGDSPTPRFAVFDKIDGSNVRILWLRMFPETE